MYKRIRYIWYRYRYYFLSLLAQVILISYAFMSHLFTSELLLVAFYDSITNNITISWALPLLVIYMVTAHARETNFNLDRPQIYQVLRRVGFQCFTYFFIQFVFYLLIIGKHVLFLSTADVLLFLFQAIKLTGHMVIFALFCMAVTQLVRNVWIVYVFFGLMLAGFSLFIGLIQSQTGSDLVTGLFLLINPVFLYEVGHNVPFRQEQALVYSMVLHAVLFYIVFGKQINTKMGLFGAIVIMLFTLNVTSTLMRMNLEMGLSYLKLSAFTKQDYDRPVIVKVYNLNNYLTNEHNDTGEDGSYNLLVTIDGEPMQAGYLLNRYVARIFSLTTVKAFPLEDPILVYKVENDMIIERAEEY